MADEISPDDLMTEPPPPGGATFTVRPEQRPPLTRDQAEKLVRKYNPDITRAAVQGEVDNMMRESDLDPARPGDEGTSAGLYQYHLSRLDDLKAFAKQQKADWRDPDIQVRFARLEKERDYPGLLKLQQTTDDPDAANKAFKRIFERPASVLWAHDAAGRPVIGTDQFKYSDAALKDDADLRYMTPAEYLDLTPDLEVKPFQSPSGRALMRSFNRGDDIEETPSLDIAVKGPTATVTDQDGRHRALLAQQNGIPAMPVAVRQTGAGEPTEIVGADGRTQAFDFPKVKGYQAPSLGQRIMGAVIPAAAAAEPDWGQNDRVVTPAPASEPGAETWGQDDQVVQAAPDSAAMSFAKGAARGFGETVFEGQKLIGKGMQALDIPGGTALAADAQQREAEQERLAATDRAAHPVASGVGEFGGGVVAPALLGGAAADVLRAGAIGTGMLQGGLGGLLNPTGDDPHFWRDKLLATTLGTGAGAGAAAAGNALTRLAKPALRATVQKLMNEGVELTPGQIAGGFLKRAEDWLVSHPIAGSQVIERVRRSFATFNRAAINRALDDIGKKLPAGLDSGFNAIAWAQDEFNKAYDAVIPQMVGQVDTAFRSDLGTILTKAANENLPQEYQETLRHVMQNEIAAPFVQNGGSLPGDAVQKIGTQLDSLVKPMQKSDNPYVQQMSRYLREADGALDDMMARQNPTFQAAKDRIDAGYAKFKTVQDATGKPGSAPDGSFTPAQLYRSVMNRDRSKDKAAFKRGDALLQDLANAARDVLPQTVPNSGTPERLAFLSLLGGGTAGLGYLEPTSLLAALTLATPYTAPGSRAVNFAVRKLASMPAPAAQNALANIFRGGAQIAAPALGAALGARASPSVPVMSLDDYARLRGSGPPPVLTPAPQQ